MNKWKSIKNTCAIFSNLEKKKSKFKKRSIMTTEIIYKIEKISIRVKWVKIKIKMMKIKWKNVIFIFLYINISFTYILSYSFNNILSIHYYILTSFFFIYTLIHFYYFLIFFNLKKKIRANIFQNLSLMMK